jgi:hypothetical protein
MLKKYLNKIVYLKQRNILNNFCAETRVIRTNIIQRLKFCIFND